MLKRIIAITFILACTSIAWFILAGSITSRTNESDAKLKPGVASIWGAAQEQRPPAASYVKVDQERSETETDGRKTARTQTRHTTVCLAPESSRVNVSLALDYRQKGLLWYSTYVVDFAGVYTFHNPTSEPQLVTFHLKFPADQAVYDGVTMEVNGRPLPFIADKHGVFVSAPLAPDATATLRSAYRSQGLESWRYKLGDEIAQSRDFELSMKTNFKQIDFPPDTLSPSSKQETSTGWDLAWRYKNLISGFQIGMTMPHKLQPGPLAGEISYFAPVSLLLFFFLMFIISTLRNIDLHPMNYFFLAAAFFAFHLLLAYLVDHISIHLAFLICSVVSVFLVVSYLRLVVGLRFAVVEAGSAQLIYLVLFSYAFFIKGFSALTVTIGCIVTLFVVMQLTARIRWADKFAGNTSANATVG
ncbi:MAG: inner membrane CreD family protein [Acidobacteriia bacterium]|nr:inner membrane CreD family protein [Terriglobia bacterium]